MSCALGGRHAEGADALDGTRLTIQALTGVHRTYELSIRTPCTPPRWAQFEAELQAVWERFVAAAVADDLPAVEREVLTLVFYWYVTQLSNRSRRADHAMHRLGV